MNSISTALLDRPVTERNDIGMRLDILDRLLSSKETVHPIICDCAIKSRKELNHLPTCPYRQLRELLRLLRSVYSDQSPDEWYERERAAFIAWWEAEGQKTFSETTTLAAGAGWLARAEAARSTS